MLKKPGDLLNDACVRAENEVILVAPYIKANVLQRLFEVIPSEVSKIVCVTRWKAEDVAHGASDLEVYDVIAEREGATLLLHPFLHAKYFRVDQQCFIGSANLTLSALGWRFPHNLEILTIEDPNKEDLKTFEHDLLEHSVLATEEIRGHIAETAAALKGLENATDSDDFAYNPRYGILGWLPRCQDLLVLYKLYSGQDVSNVITSTQTAARYDLAALGIPPGLPESEFWINVRTNFSLMPLVDKINTLAKTGLNPDAGAKIISDYTALDGPDEDGFEPATYWKILTEWMAKLFPGKYTIKTTGTSFTIGSDVIRYNRE